MADMEISIDIHDELLRRPGQYAELTGQPLRAVVEEGLRLVLDAKREPYKLPDKSVGTPGGPFPLASRASMDWTRDSGQLSQVQFKGR